MIKQIFPLVFVLFSPSVLAEPRLVVENGSVQMFVLTESIKKSPNNTVFATIVTNFSNSMDSPVKSAKQELEVGCKASKVRSHKENVYSQPDADGPVLASPIKESQDWILITPDMPEGMVLAYLCAINF